MGLNFVLNFRDDGLKLIQRSAYVIELLISNFRDDGL